MDQETNWTDNEWTMGREREIERGKNYTNQSSNVTAILHRWSRSSLLLVKSENNEMFHLPVFELEACNRLKKKGGCCYSKLKGICTKKAALKEGIQLIVFGFVFQVLTSIPLKFWKLTPTERKVRSSSRIFANAIATLCAEKRVDLVVFGFGFVVVNSISLKLYRITFSKRTFQSNKENVRKNVVAIYRVTCHLIFGLIVKIRSHGIKVFRPGNGWNRQKVNNRVRESERVERPPPTSRQP